MKHVLLVTLFSLPLGLVAHDPTPNRPQPHLSRESSQHPEPSFRISRLASQQRAATLRRLRGETRRQRMLVLRAIVAVTNELNQEADQANQSEEQ